MQIRLLAVAGWLMMRSSFALAGPMVLRLWPADPPAAGVYDASDKIDYYDASKTAFNVSNVKTPSMAVYLPAADAATPRAAVVVCPGGGYGVEAAGHEGSQIAERLTAKGIVAIVVKYRLPGGVAPAAGTLPLPQRDAMRAMQLVRERAGEWKLDLKRIGIMGFSAGGHLAASVATLYGDAASFAGDAGKDAAAKLSARPDFAVLMYPVASLGEVTHMGSRNNLLGDHATPELISRFSNELHVTPQTPPMFIVHASDDDAVPVANALLMASAAAKAKVPCTLLLLAKGGHGFGLGDPAKPTGQWFDAMVAWIETLPR